MGWFTKKECVECRIHAVTIDTQKTLVAELRRQLEESRVREKLAIDQLLAFQGKPGISTAQLTTEQADAVMNPFHQIGKGKPFAPGIFDDVLNRASG